MATPDDLISNYGDSEFSGFDALHLTRAIERAAQTVSRYVPIMPPAGSRAATALASVTLTLARAYAHDEQVLGDDHPVVREMREALRWLERVASNQIAMDGRAGGVYAAGIAVIADAPVFTSALFAKWPK